MQKEMDRLRNNLSALLNSRPSGIPMDQLQDHYVREFGDPINYKNFGYDHMLDFLYGMSEIIRVEPGQKNGEKVVFAATNDEQVTSANQLETYCDERDQARERIDADPPKVDYMAQLQELMRTPGKEPRKVKSPEEEGQRIVPDETDNSVPSTNNARAIKGSQSEEILAPKHQLDSPNEISTVPGKISDPFEKVSGIFDSDDEETVLSQPTLREVRGSPIQGAQGGIASGRRGKGTLSNLGRYPNKDPNDSDIIRNYQKLRKAPQAASRLNQRIERNSSRVPAPGRNRFVSPPNRKRNVAPVPVNDHQAWKNQLQVNDEGVYIVKMPAQPGMNLEDLEGVFVAYGSTGVEKNANDILVIFEDQDAAAQVLTDMSYMYQLTILDECNTAPGKDPYGTQVLKEYFSKKFDASCTPSVYIGHIPDDLDMEDILVYFNKFDVIGWRLQVVRNNRHALLYFDTLDETQTAACLANEMMTEDDITLDVTLSKDTERLIRLVQTSNADYLTSIARKGDTEKSERRRPLIQNDKPKKSVKSPGNEAEEICLEKEDLLKLEEDFLDIADVEVASSADQSDKKRPAQIQKDTEAEAEESEKTLPSEVNEAEDTFLERKDRMKLKEMTADNTVANTVSPAILDNGKTSDQVDVETDQVKNEEVVGLKESLGSSRPLKLEPLSSERPSPDVERETLMLNGRHELQSPENGFGGARPKQKQLSRQNSDTNTHNKKMNSPDISPTNQYGSDQERNFRQELLEIEQMIKDLTKKKKVPTATLR